VQKTLTENIKLVVGIGPRFPGADYIEYRLSKHIPKIPLKHSLADACRTAVDLIV
jgi:hypothetical protein